MGTSHWAHLTLSSCSANSSSLKPNWSTKVVVICWTWYSEKAWATGPGCSQETPCYFSGLLPGPALSAGRPQAATSKQPVTLTFHSPTTSPRVSSVSSGPGGAP